MDSSANICDALIGQGRPDDVALIDGARQYSYADLRRATAVQARTILSWNLEPGSRIALIAPNSLFWVASYLAIIRVGHTAVPLPATLTPDDVAKKMRHVGCDSLLIDERLTRRLGSVASHLARVQTSATMWATLDTSDQLLLPDARLAAEDAVLVFTSGTTSAPRAVCVTHENIRANTDSILEFLQLNRADRMLVILPFSYCYGASLLHTHLAVGASLRLCETQAFPGTIVQAIENDHCTGVAGVPSSYQLLLRASTFGSHPLPTLRLIQQAGGRLPQPQLEQLASSQPQAQLFVMYGQTEATARLAYLPPHLLPTKTTSVGRAIPGVHLRICDENGCELPVGDVGEVRATGENITRGYWNDSAGTAAKYVGGELRTGDLGRFDQDGFLYIVDRSDDFIKSWGIRISSHEIEDTVLELEQVTAAAVVGRPDAEAGEAIVLFVVRQPDAETDDTHIRRFLRSRLAKHLIPHEIRFLQQLPMNENGKIVKTELRKLARASVVAASS